MRLPLLLFLFFEVSYSNPTSQLPEGLIQRGSIHNGQIYLDRDVLQKFINSALPSSGNISPYQGEEGSTAVVGENTQNQQNYQHSPKYQHVTQYPKKYQGQEEAGVLKREESVQQNINHPHVHKRMAEENAFVNQNFNQQPQNVPPPSQMVYQQLRRQSGQATYQPNVAGNHGDLKQDQENQAQQKIIQHQQMLQHQQQQILQQRQMEQKALLIKQQQHQLKLQQQQFHEQQHQQQQHQVQQLQQYQQQQHEQSKNFQPPAYLPINANHQQIQQVPQVQGPEVPPNFLADGRFPVPPAGQGLPPYLYHLNRQQRGVAPTPNQFAIYPPLLRQARHQPNGGVLRHPPFYFSHPARPHLTLSPTPPSVNGAEEQQQTPSAELQPQQLQVSRTYQTGTPKMVRSQS